MNNNQRKQVQEIFKLINITQFSKKYNRFGTSGYLSNYIKGNVKRTKRMDLKIQSMLLDYVDDLQELIMIITKKINVQ